VVFGEGDIKLYDKKNKCPDMRHIDYGLSAFKASAFDDWPADRPFDLSDVMQRLVAHKQLAGFEVKQRFYEIGSPAGLAELEVLLSGAGPR
jgi:NDP-sugar pyrophosphorylase family protein